MDAFIKYTSLFCDELLPIVGVIVLICLAVFLVKLIGLVKDLDITLNKSHKTIDLVDMSIEKVQAPLDTAVKVSKGVDKACDVTAEAIDKTKEFIVNNADKVKEKVNSLVKPKEEEIKEPSPEDIIGE